MNIYTCTGFQGHYPVGTAAVVVAQDRGHARRLLNRELAAQNLPEITDLKQIQLVDSTVAKATILLNGEY